MIREAYTPLRATASVQLFVGQGILSHFVCAVTGTLQIRNTNAAGTVLVETFDVVEGNVYNFAFAMNDGCYAELTAAKGTFGISWQG